MAYVIAEPSVDILDRSCVEECPIDCIYEGKRMLYIHPTECVECAACEVVCPVGAVYHEDELPETWLNFAEANAMFCDELGTPGGASALGPLNRDVTLVANLPRRQR